MARFTDHVVLDRVEPDWTPPYCTHGKATCVVCRKWTWLGDKTFEAVNAGRARPICKQCALANFSPANLAGHIDDHRRADGPH